MQKDINDLIKEISKRDRIITELMCNAFARKYYKYARHNEVSPETLINSMNFERVDLTELCNHMQDQAISEVFERSEQMGGSNIEKAQKISEDLRPMLNDSYAKQLENEVRVALDTRRIQLLKNQ